MTELVLDDIWVYTGACLIIVMAFCCCFNVVELVKLGFLKKLTSPERYSLSGASTTDLSDSRRTSPEGSRRPSSSDNLSPCEVVAPKEKSPGNFATFTVIAIPPPSIDPLGDFGVLEEDTEERAMDELLGEIVAYSNCSRFLTPRPSDDPPRYETLFSSSPNL